MIRAFLALDHPAEIDRRLAQVQQSLRRSLHGEIRWVRPEGIHLTLKFLGDIPEADVARTAAAVERAVRGVAPFELAVGGPGVFPDPRRPRVLWLGLTGDIARLVLFQKQLDRALEEIGFAGEERPFRPHLTLARIKAPQGLAGLAAMIERREAEAAVRYVAAGLSLYRSELTPAGAVYTKLRGFVLAAGNAVSAADR
jgi:2'-5' RNA ligase